MGGFQPYLSLYYKSLGLSGPTIGLLQMAGTLALVASQAGWGALVDWTQAPRRVLVALLPIAVVAYLLFLSAATDVWLLAALSALVGVLTAGIVPIANAMALTQAERQGLDYGRLRLGGSYGFAVAAGLAGLFYTGGMALSAIFLWIAVAMGAAWMATRALPDEVREREPVDLRAGLAELAGDWRFMGFLGLSLVLQVANVAHATFFSLYLRELGGAPWVIGLAWALGAVAEMPVLRACGGWFKRWGTANVLAVAFFAYALRYAAYVVIDAPLLAVAVQLAHGFSFGLFYMGAIVYVGELSPLRLRTTGQAIFLLVYSGLGAVVGNPLGGWLLDRWGKIGLYGMASALALLAGVGFVLLLLKARRK